MMNLEPSEDDDADGTHPPLAQDANGNLVAVPAGTAAWKIQEDTRGRPSTIKDPGGNTRRFPLTTTPLDLADEFGRGPFRVVALDKLGHELGLVTVLSTAILRRNGPAGGHAANSNDTATSSTDWRYALETIAGIARTNADALRAVADSQADWIKTIAMAKGLPRNVAMYRPAVVEHERDDDSGGADDNDDSNDADDDADHDADEQEYRNAAPVPAEPAQPAASMHMQIASAVTEQVMKALVPLLTSLGAGIGKRLSGAPPTAPPPPPVIDVPVAPEPPPSMSAPMLHLARIQQQLTVEERAILASLLADPSTCAQVASELAATSVEDAVAKIHAVSRRPTPPKNSSRRPPRPPATPSPAPDLSGIPTLDTTAVMRLLEIRNALSPDEQSEVTALMTTLSASEQYTWAEELTKLDFAAAIQRVRTELTAKRSRNTNLSK